MTPEQQKWLDDKFLLIEMHNAYNQALLHALIDAMEDGDINASARDKAYLEMRIVMETHGKDGSEILAIEKRLRAEAKAKKTK